MSDVIIRMYNVGFGDAFLVKVPAAGKRTLTILVDCGSIAAGPHPMKEIVAQIIEDVTVDGKARIDLVIATHRHRDHVSGFADAAWDEVEVGEVWMPWTEDPKDPDATKIREHQAALAMNLAAGFAPKRTSVSSEPDIESWTNEHHQMALNALANEHAMSTLHDGFAGAPKRRYLPVRKAKGSSVATGDPIRLAGVTFHIAGPTFEEQVIRDMDPPAGHSYLAMLDGVEPGVPAVPRLFPDFWSVSPSPAPLTDAERRRIDGATADLSETALASLESAVNGTSLFVIMQVGGTNFVFPGDAQWGTWNAVLTNPSYREMLKQTKFYKVGHHGSHNATPTDFVTKLDEDIVAMASVRPITKWPDVPRAPLLAALHQHGKVARSDELDHLDAAFEVGDDKLYIETRISIGAVAVVDAEDPPKPDPKDLTSKTTKSTKTTKSKTTTAKTKTKGLEVASALAFVADAPIPLSPPMLGIAADPSADPVFDAARDQATVVGADIVAFTKGVSPETRKDIVNASLLAQLVAKKRMPAPTTLDDWTVWYEEYFDTLAHIGFAIQDVGFDVYQTAGETFQADKEIIEVATGLLAGAPGAVAAITKTLKALEGLAADSKWITLFDRESRSANTARFQATIASTDDATGSVLVSLIAFGLEAKTTVTQVLFFKFHKSDITLKRHSGRVSISVEILTSVRDAIAQKLTGFASRYVRALPDL